MAGMEEEDITEMAGITRMEEMVGMTGMAIMTMTIIKGIKHEGRITAL